LQQMFERYRAAEPAAAWQRFLEHLYPVDAFLAAACLEGVPLAWETLFAARAGRADRLLVDALRARAVRLFPRDEERQESAVNDFWGHLIVAETPGAVPILARYDGQRPLVPWLIRVFQNWQISLLRSREGKAEALADDDLLEDRELPVEPESRWHESFCDAARAWLTSLPEQELLLLGLRLRYRLSQREVANLLGVHEGTISRQITHLRDRCFEVVGQQLVAEGWTGDDLIGFVYNEMAGLVMDEPRLSADYLARILSGRGKKLPA
jgi:RNA polymerase sigma factor (sigma-70 family)